MSDRQESPDRELLEALRQLSRQTVVPDVDPAREAQLLSAFDTVRTRKRPSRAGYWWMAALATATALLIAIGITRAGAGRRNLPPASAARTHMPVDSDGVQSQDGVGEFVTWPGAVDLPPIESGQLVRVTLPVSMLPTLGLMPPTARLTAVRADVLVGQDGLARAVRLVD
jgi:hypothetical protein